MNIELSEYQTQATINALTDKVQRLESELHTERNESLVFFNFIQDMPQEDRLNFVKESYDFAFDNAAWGLDIGGFKAVLGAIDSVWQCAEDEDFASKIYDYVWRLEATIKQIEDTNQIYDTGHLFGYELED